MEKSVTVTITDDQTGDKAEIKIQINSDEMHVNLLFTPEVSPLKEAEYLGVTGLIMEAIKLS